MPYNSIYIHLFHSILTLDNVSLILPGEMIWRWKPVWTSREWRQHDDKAAMRNKENTGENQVNEYQVTVVVSVNLKYHIICSELSFLLKTFTIVLVN